MLIQNPLTSYLYEFGYEGVDNIYDYWLENRNEIINAYKSINPEYCDEVIKSFQYKVRWNAMSGLYLRLMLQKKVREANGSRELNLKQLTVKYGKRYLTFDKFSHMTSSEDMLNEKTDLRGISFLKKTVQHITIRNVDFSYAAFDTSMFIGVKFENCTFNNTSFNACQLIDCIFDNSCIMRGDDFRAALIKSEFLTPIIEPQISVLSRRDKLFRKHKKRTRYHTHTIILRNSFLDNSDLGENTQYFRWLKQEVEQYF